VKTTKIIMALISGALVMAAAPVRADTRDDVLSGVARCGVIHDDRVWLDCMYGAQQPMRSQLGLPPAPEFQQRLVPGPGVAPPPMRAMASAPAPVRVAPRKKPGFFDTLVGNAPPVADSRMSGYRYEKGGAFVVELENGQEWRQTDVAGGGANWTRKASSYRVVVTQGTFGSFSLRTNDNPRKFKVERIH
jgi:hypothetical protein